MRNGFRSYCLSGMACLFILALCGCGDDSSARPEIGAIPDEEHYGGTIKSMLYEFQAKVKKYGVKAAKQDLPILLESFEGYEKQPVGSHADTYKQIVDKLKAMESSLGSAGRDAVLKAANEIGTLADKLPGKGNKNPVVD